MAFTWLLELSPDIPLVVDAPALIHNRRIYAYYLQLKNVIASYGRKLEIDISSYDRALLLERAIYPNIEGYYKAIALELNPSFDPSKLTALSRFNFFIETPAPIKLSGLEQLLGLSYSETPEVPDGESPPVFKTLKLTSGDSEIDLMADVFLVFKEQADYLVQTYSAEYLNKLVAQASNRLNESEIKSKEQTKIDNAVFEKNANVINKKFKSNGAAGVIF